MPADDTASTDRIGQPGGGVQAEPAGSHENEVWYLALTVWEPADPNVVLMVIGASSSVIRTQPASLTTTDAVPFAFSMVVNGIGDRVSFQAEGRPLLVGMITRYNKKTVTVITESGQRWNVAPGLLSRVNSSQSADSRSTNVIQLHKK